MSEEMGPRIAANEEPQDEVEGHGFKLDANAEPADEGADEVEAHGLPRQDQPRVD